MHAALRPSSTAPRLPLALAETCCKRRLASCRRSEHVGEFAAQALVGADEGVDRCACPSSIGARMRLGRLRVGRGEFRGALLQRGEHRVVRACRVAMTEPLRSSRLRRRRSVIAATSRPIASPRSPRLDTSDRPCVSKMLRNLADAAAEGAKNRRPRSSIAPTTPSSRLTTRSSNIATRWSRVLAISSARPPKVRLISDARTPGVSADLRRTRAKRLVDLRGACAEGGADLGRAVAESLLDISPCGCRGCR